MVALGARRTLACTSAWPWACEIRAMEVLREGFMEKEVRGLSPLASLILRPCVLLCVAVCACRHTCVAAAPRHFCRSRRCVCPTVPPHAPLAPPTSLSRSRGSMPTDLHGATCAAAAGLPQRLLPLVCGGWWDESRFVCPASRCYRAAACPPPSCPRIYRHACSANCGVAMPLLLPSPRAVACGLSASRRP